MKYYTFEKTDPKDDGFYDLFESSVVYDFNNNQHIKYVIADDSVIGDLSKVSIALYGTNEYTEELMVLNNLISPYCINNGDILMYFEDVSLFSSMYKTEKSQNDQKDTILNMNKNKSTQKDANRIGAVPTIKPDNIKQLSVDYNKKKIEIINKFK